MFLQNQVNELINRSWNVDPTNVYGLFVGGTIILTVTAFVVAQRLFVRTEKKLEEKERQVTTIKDTTYIVWINGLGYERHDIEYEGGGFNYFQSPNAIGDTAAVTNYLFAKAVNANQEVGGAAIEYLNGGSVARQIFSAFNTMFQALTGVTLQVAAANYFKEQILGDYRLTLPTNESSDYELVQQPNGTLRMRLKSNQATFFTAVAMSQNTLRLNNLDNGANVPFYLVGTNANGKPLYFSIDRRYKLVRL